MKKIEDGRWKMEERIVLSVLDLRSSVLDYFTLPRALLRLS
jgi:hypothetical protein